MLKSLFFSYLSSAWKRLVRTIAVLNCLFWLPFALQDAEGRAIFSFTIIANVLLSYTFELFVKKNQKNELWVSLLVIAFNVISFTLFIFNV